MLKQRSVNLSIALLATFFGAWLGHLASAVAFSFLVKGGRGLEGALAIAADPRGRWGPPDTLILLAGAIAIYSLSTFVKVHPVVVGLTLMAAFFLAPGLYYAVFFLEIPNPPGTPELGIHFGLLALRAAVGALAAWALFRLGRTLLSQDTLLRSKNRQAGFTLVELLVVITIIAILAALVFTLASAAIGKAKETVSVSNMRQLYSAVILYEDDHDGNAPRTLPRAFQYARSKEIFRCPGDTVQEPLFRDYPADVIVRGAPRPPNGGGERSSYRVSYAYLRTNPPYLRDESVWWAAMRERPQTGMIASPWFGKRYKSYRETGLEDGDMLIDGPVLRIDMDGSLFRLPKWREAWPTLGADFVTLFFDRGHGETYPLYEGP